MASDRRIILSNWRTVILHEDFVIPERERKRKREGGEEGGMVGRKEGREDMYVKQLVLHFP